MLLDLNREVNVVKYDSQTADVSFQGFGEYPGYVTSTIRMNKVQLGQLISYLTAIKDTLEKVAND